MKHSQLLFEKDLYDLTFEDMEEFFSTEKEESLNLEFKSFPQQGDYPSKEAAIKKAVCGLLNSEGGIIIWGAPTETKHPNGNTTAVGALTPFTSPLDRDRMINILSSTISPMPIGIRVQVLKNANDESIFVIEVEKSIERPHQYDNRYFIRLDGQTRIAPHYLISALMKSTNFPILSGHIRLKGITILENNIRLQFRRLVYNASAYNNEINMNMRIVASPGIIIINHVPKGEMYNETYPILSNGAPLLSDFFLAIPTEQIHGEIFIAYQFGGEKSPSKISKYTYQLPGNLPIGKIADESIYLVEKSENQLPDGTSTIEERVNFLLDD